MTSPLRRLATALRWLALLPIRFVAWVYARRPFEPDSGPRAHLGGHTRPPLHLDTVGRLLDDERALREAEDQRATRLRED